MPTAIIDLSEMWKALRTALLTDTALVERLGAADAIYLEWPSIKVTYPIITLVPGPRNPSDVAKDRGLYNPELTLNIYGVDRFACEALYAVIESRWSIPLNRPALIESANYRLTSLDPWNCVQVGRLRLLDTDQEVYQLAVECKTRIARKSA